MSIELHDGDLPGGLDLGNLVAVDCEMMGLKTIRDRLCLVQISSGDGNAHLVKFKKDRYSAPNLVKILGDPNVTKIFHYARQDIATLWAYLNVLTRPVYCTKVASKMARTFTPNHGLKSVAKDLLNVDLTKQLNTSDWGAEELTQDQLEYAASDVLYLHQIKERLDALLTREERLELAQSCFDFLPTRAILDVAGWQDEDIFEH